jgi:hypothetical protein
MFGATRQVKEASSGEYPEQEGRTQTPNQSCARTGCAPGKKQSKCKSESRAEKST